MWTGQWGLSSGLERLAWGRGPTAPHPFGRTRVKMHTRRGVCASVEINKTQGCVSDIFHGR